MKKLGANVVRIHLQFARFMKSPTQPDEENLARLGKLVRLAEANGVYLDVTGLGSEKVYLSDYTVAAEFVNRAPFRIIA